MSSPTTALIWEIWRRGRRFGYLALGSVAFSALLNLLGPERFGTSPVIQGLCWFLMVCSFVFLFGCFNCTEINSTREWNGFPYRLFALPVRTWKLVTLPIFLGVVSVELVYVIWLKLVWTHDNISSPEWFAVVLGAYMVFYQTALWGLAGFRVMRLLVLGVGGSSSVLVACFPLFKSELSPVFSEARASLFMAALAVVSFLIAWGTVARQRSGGGRRQSWLKAVLDRITDALPRRTKDFASPAAAQFWYEWRRAGWLLPACIAFILVFVVTPIAWFNRADPEYMNYVFGRILIVPIVLAFAIGKGFCKVEFWSRNLSLPSFLATRPLPAGEFVIGKMKVAAVSAALTWFLILGYMAAWIYLRADSAQVGEGFYMIRMLFPHSWPVVIFLNVAGLAVLTWRGMVGGLWVGLSGRTLYYAGAAWLQVIAIVMLSIVLGISSDAIDRQIEHHPDVVKSVAISAIGWTLTVLVVLKLWLAVFAWSRITPRRSRQYLFIWLGATLCFVALAILSAPWADPYRLEHLFVLAALLVVPFARLGLAPWALAKNRHR